MPFIAMTSLSSTKLMDKEAFLILLSVSIKHGDFTISLGNIMVRTIPLAISQLHGLCSGNGDVLLATVIFHHICNCV